MNSDHARVEDEELTVSSKRDRILDAALQEFAEHGFRGASIRGIAAAAGVSPGSVQHHFGTKEGLRDACDARVMSYLSDVQSQMVRKGDQPNAEVMGEQLTRLQPMIDYLITSMNSGSESARHWFHEITDYTYESFTSGRLGPAFEPSVETRAIAAVQAAHALGITAFYRHIQEVLGIEDQNELMVKVGKARLFLASEKVIGDELRQRLEEALDEYEQRNATGKPPPPAGKWPNDEMPRTS